MREIDSEQRRDEYEHTLLGELQRILLGPEEQARRIEHESPRIWI